MRRPANPAISVGRVARRLWGSLAEAYIRDTTALCAGRASVHADAAADVRCRAGTVNATSGSAALWALRYVFAH